MNNYESEGIEAQDHQLQIGTSGHETVAAINVSCHSYTNFLLNPQTKLFPEALDDIQPS